MATVSDRESEATDQAADIEESLRKSYLVMKTKLDEMELYSKTLETQLGSIFKSISQSGQTVVASKAPVLSVEEEEEEEEGRGNWKSVRASERSNEDTKSCQALSVLEMDPVLDQTQQHKNSILHISEEREEPRKPQNTDNKMKNVDLSEIIRYLSSKLLNPLRSTKTLVTIVFLTYFERRRMAFLCQILGIHLSKDFLLDRLKPEMLTK